MKKCVKNNVKIENSTELKDSKKPVDIQEDLNRIEDYLEHKVKRRRAVKVNKNIKEKSNKKITEDKGFYDKIKEKLGFV